MPRSLLALVLIASACGAPTEMTAANAVATDRVRVFDDPSTAEAQWGYAPRVIRVAAGATVTFANAGAVFHTVTSDDPKRTFDKALEPGEQVRIHFDAAGTWAYHCGVHPDMKGIVEVT